MLLRRVIGSNIRAGRIAAGLTQEQLAKRARINVQHLSRLEREGSNLTIENLEALAKALGVPITDLFQSTTLGGAPSKTTLDKFDEALRFLQGFRSLLDR